jgi:hypothetical protein
MNGESKGKLYPRSGLEGPEGMQSCSCALSLTSVLYVGGWVVNATPLPLYPRK